jgi:hypothetical protein
LLFGAALWLLSFGVAFAYLSDGDEHTPLAYAGFLADGGETYIDAIFATSVRRISDAINTPQAGGGGNLDFVMTEYSTMSPFSQDNSRLILQHVGYYGLYDGAGSFLSNLPLEISASSEPRWSRSESRVLYFVSGNELKEHNVDGSTTSVVHTFSEYAVISGKGESDISLDGDHFVFVGDNRYVFVYTISSGAKSAVLDTADLGGFDSVHITPDNNVTVTWLQAGSARYNGIELFDGNVGSGGSGGSGAMQFLRQVTRAGGHMDVGRDTNGAEVLLWANGADPAPVCNNGVVKVRLSDASQTCLATFDWSLALNVSAPDDSGWVFVATYAPSDPDPQIDPWPAYTNEIVQVKMDGTSVRRLAHHRSRPLNDYNYTPRPSVSRDGTLLAFSSNFGMQESGYPTDYADAYLIDVSAGSTPPIAAPTLASPSESISVATPSYTWSAVSGASRYQLWVENAAGTVLINVSYAAAEAACASGAVCEVTPSTGLDNGDFKWWVRASNSAGYGPWSARKDFTVLIVVPTATLITPQGSTPTQTPTYTWEGVSTATWYYLWVDGPGGTYVRQWYATAQVGCAGGGTCSVTPSISLAASGAHKWWIRAWDATTGNGPWSARGDFDVTGKGGPPPKATFLAPSGTISSSAPTYTWSATGGSTWYLLWVGKGGTKLYERWVSAADAGCASGVGTCSVTPTPGGQYDPPALTPGNYTVYVRTWGPGGDGPWSATKSFAVQ